MIAPHLRELLARLMPVAIAWAEAEARRADLVGVRLTTAERRAAEAVGVAAPDRVRVVRADALPLPQQPLLRVAATRMGILGPGTAGLTLGHAIFVLRREDSPRLITHELRHVHQYERAGSIGDFFPAYLAQLLEFGYHDAPFEIDARAHEQHGMQ